MNPGAIQEYLFFQAPLSDESMFEGVFRLAPGNSLLVDASGKVQTLRKYWDLCFNVDYNHTEEYFVDATCGSKVRDAVQLHLRSDVPSACIFQAAWIRVPLPAWLQIF